MRRTFKDVPPMQGNVGITVSGNSVEFPEGTLELFNGTVFVLPEELEENQHREYFNSRWVRYYVDQDGVFSRAYTTSDHPQSVVLTKAIDAEVIRLGYPELACHTWDSWSL